MYLATAPRFACFQLHPKTQCAAEQGVEDMVYKIVTKWADMEHRISSKFTVPGYNVSWVHGLSSLRFFRLFILNYSRVFFFFRTHEARVDDVLRPRQRLRFHRQQGACLGRQVRAVPSRGKASCDSSIFIRTAGHRQEEAGNRCRVVYFGHRIWRRGPACGKAEEEEEEEAERRLARARCVASNLICTKFDRTSVTFFVQGRSRLPNFKSFDRA